ncbi:MAG: hypothetical protein WCA04_12655 [Geobacteraceae bacterium]
MDSGEKGNSCRYLIDGADRIICVSGNWLAFAQRNEAAESCHPDRVINRSIWDFVDGIETTHLYELILEKVRSTDRSVRVPFRCDAPGTRRYLELLITPVQRDFVEFVSALLYEEPRDHVELLASGVPRSEEFIRICSMCKKVELSKNSWVEIEEAIEALRLFDKTTLPQITHGLCHECFAYGMAEVEKL